MSSNPFSVGIYCSHMLEKEKFRARSEPFIGFIPFNFMVGSMGCMYLSKGKFIGTILFGNMLLNIGIYQLLKEDIRYQYDEMEKRHKRDEEFLKNMIR